MTIQMETVEQPKEIARCRRCGRGFIMLGTRNDFIDHFGPLKGSGVEPNADGECGGSIQMIS